MQPFYCVKQLRDVIEIQMRGGNSHYFPALLVLQKLSFLLLDKIIIIQNLCSLPSIQRSQQKYRTVMSNRIFLTKVTKNFQRLTLWCNCFLRAMECALIFFQEVGSHSQPVNKDTIHSSSSMYKISKTYRFLQNGRISLT